MAHVFLSLRLCSIAVWRIIFFGNIFSCSVQVGSCKSTIRNGQPCNSFPRSWLTTDFSIPHRQTFLVTLFSTQSNQHKSVYHPTASAQLDEGFGNPHLSKEMETVWLQCWALNSTIILRTGDLKDDLGAPNIWGNCASPFEHHSFRGFCRFFAHFLEPPSEPWPNLTLPPTSGKTWPRCAEAGRREDQGRL